MRWATALLPALLLAATLIASIAAAASTPSQGPQDNTTATLAEEIRSLLKRLNTTGLPVEELRGALQSLRECYPGTGAAEAATAILRSLGAGGPSHEQLHGLYQALQRLPAEANGPQCSRRRAAEAVYTLALAAFYQPTGLGVLLPPSSEHRVTVTIHGGKAPGNYTCGIHGAAALLAAAAAGWIDDNIAKAALKAAPGLNAECLVAAVGYAGPPIPLANPGGPASNITPSTAEALLEAYAAAAGAPPGPPPWVFEHAVRLLRDSRPLAVGILRLLEARYPSYALALAALTKTRDPALYYAEKRAQGEPRPELPIRESIYCLAEKLLIHSLASGKAGPETGVAEMLGEAASLCQGATGRGIQEALKTNPYIPLDYPALEAAGRTRGPEAAVAEASWRELPNPLLVPITPGEAEELLHRAGLAIPLREAPGLAYHLDLLLDRVTRSRGDLTLLGYLVRAASIREKNTSLYLSYAAARIIAWALVNRGHVNFPNLVLNEMQSPIDPYYVIFTIPGRQRITLWALGWVTTLNPPQAQTTTQARGGLNETNTTPLSKTITPLLPMPRAGAAPSPEQLEQLAQQLRSIPGGEAYATILEEAAKALQKGDYAAAAAAAEKLRKILENLVGKENAQRLIEEAAKALGMDPQQLARLLAEAASLKPSGEGVTIDIEKATVLAKTLTGEEKTARGATGGEGETRPRGGGGLARSIARIIAESTKMAAENPSGTRVINVKGLAWLLQNTGLQGLFTNITGLIESLASGSSAAAAPPTSLSPLGGGAAGASPPLPPPPPAPRLSGKTRLAIAATAAALLFALAARRGALQSLIAEARMRRIESRLAAAAKKPGEGSVGEEEARQAFAALLEALGRAYRPRRPSETHREYGRGLRGAAASLYWAAAEAYERLRFGHGAPGDLERLREALSRARRLLSRRGGRRGG